MHIIIIVINTKKNIAQYDKVAYCPLNCGRKILRFICLNNYVNILFLFQCQSKKGEF